MAEVMAFGVEPSSRRYHLRLARYKAIAETLAAIAGQHVQRTGRPLQLLDVGAGNGRTLRYLEAEGRAEQVNFHALELSERRIAGMYGRERWTVVRGDAQAGVPFADATFDCAICEQVLEHLHHPLRAIGEIGRILRPGGYLIAGVPSFPPGMLQLREHVGPVVKRMFGLPPGDHPQTFSLKRFRSLVERSGLFDVTEARGFRITSGGPWAALENYRWYYRAQRRLGQALPSMCIEVQLIARRKLN